MRRNFRLPGRIPLKDPRVVVRAVLGVLVVANLVAALIAVRPWGGSAEDLARERQRLRQQLAQMQSRLDKSKALAAKVDLARKEGDQFLTKYVTDRQTTMSTIGTELTRIAKEAGVKDKGLNINLEPVEGSDTLVQMTVAAAYEGNYATLAKLMNLLDKSERFLIIESMVATPQQSSPTITVSLKLDTFVREQAGSTS
jgi:DNA repair ATPase RecN